MVSPSDPDPAPGGVDRSGGYVPEWVRGATNAFAMLVTAVMAGAALFLVAWMAPVLGPLGLGLFLAAVAAPIFTWIERRGRSATVALGLTLTILVVVGVGIVLLAFAGARSLTDSMAGYADALQARAADVAASGSPVALRDLVSPDVLVAILRAIVGILIDVGGSFAFAIVVAALLLLDGRRLTRLVAGGLGSQNPVFREAPGLAAAAVTYVGVRVRVNAVTAVSLLALMLVLGVDDALLWAICAFFLSFVPYIGLMLALIPPTILAFAESGSVAAAVIVVGGIVLNVIAENVLEPTLTGRALSLATWLVFVMFFVWVWLMGPIGALLSMPITVLIVLVLEHSERTRWVAALLTRR